MISSLRGRVIRVEDDWAVVDVLGVGYQVYVHDRTAACLRAEPGEIQLQIHTVVREDAISLFGFLELQELVFFRHLIGVERIGPKAALAILSRTEWPALAQAISAEDHALLAAVPGIGPKTARRIVLELKGTVDQMGLPGLRAGAVTAAPAGDEAIRTLVAMGFSGAEARAAVAAELAADPNSPDGRTLEDVLRAALRRLGPGAA